MWEKDAVILQELCTGGQSEAKVAEVRNHHTLQCDTVIFRKKVPPHCIFSVYLMLLKIGVKVELDSLLFSGPKIDMWLADWILEEWFVRWEAKVTEFEALFYLMMLNVRNDFDWVKLDDILSTGAGASSHSIDIASRRHTITRHLQVHKELNAVQK